MKKLYFKTLLTLACLLLLSNAPVYSQCNASAGTMNTDPVFFCAEVSAIAIHNADQVLEADDALGFVLHDQAGTTLGNVLATNNVPVFNFQAGMSFNTVYYISAVAGNNNGGGGVDLSDPCLSVAAGTPLTFSKPVISCTPPVLTCQNTTISPNCDIQGAAPFSYSWTGPGLNSPFPEPPMSQPGIYSVTVTDAWACTMMYEIEVTEDATPPVVAISSTGTLCSGQPMILTASATGGPFLTFSWAGPGGPMSTSAILTVIAPGVYCVTVTNTITGCSTEECIVITPAPAIDISIGGDLTVPCPDQLTEGPIVAQVSGGTPPYTYIWNNGATGQAIQGLTIGTYTVTVVDANGCTAVVLFNITSEISANAGPDVLLNCQTNSVLLDGSASNGSPPDVVYQWTSPGGNIVSNAETALVSEPGTYTLEVSGTSCTTSDQVVVSAGLSIELELDRAGCDSGALYAIITPVIPGLQYNWNTPDGAFNTPFALDADETGYYELTVNDPQSGCTFGATEYFAFGEDVCSILQGRVVKDEVNCVVSGAEPGLGGWWINIDDGSQVYQTVTDANGYYSIGLPQGNYSVSVVLPSNLWMACQADYSVNLPQTGLVVTLDIPVQALAECPLMNVNIAAGILRRCFNSNYVVTYCNEGTATAEDAIIEVTLDPFLIYQTSYSIMPVAQNGQTLTYAVGDVAPGQCGSFVISVQVSCLSTLGQTHCTEAHAYPDTLCQPPSALWSGASLAVSSECDGDEVKFRISNVGAGDMVQSSQFIIIEDGVMLMTAPDTVKLDAGEFYDVSFPANGSTYRIEIEQVPHHPGESAPSLAVEGCGQNVGGGFSTGFVNQLSPDDADPYLDIDCSVNVGSYDPNDKQAVPTGFDDEHYIKRNTDIEYTLRFQNTGTDTAFTVVITDTISPYLDLATLQAGPASHPYRLEVHSGREVAFVFDHILLPDSNVNVAGSQGFVRYRISQLSDLPLETVIENKAAIFFDFNDPVWTNTTTHRIGEDFIDIVNGVINPGIKDAHLQWYPNPMSHRGILSISGNANLPDQKTLVLFDAAGKPLQRINFSGNQVEWDANNYVSGFYYYKLYAGALWVGSGKIAVARL